MVAQVHFLKRLFLLAVSGVLISSLANAQANAQEGRTRTRIQAPPPGIQQPSGADAVNKLINPGPSDPNVPLLQPGFDQQRGQRTEDPSLRGPAFYGRKEENGALLGVRVPIPADRANTATH